MFSEEQADRAVRFIESLTHTKGKWAGVPFKLLDWQRDGIVRPLFGSVREDGTRQYRKAFVEIPRKNGKSELAAAIALKLLFSDREPGAQIYGAAADRDQASLVFNVAASMVRKSPALSKVAKVVDSQKRIIFPKQESFYRAIPADAGGSHGFDAHAVIFDEIHTQPNRELWDVLSTSTGARTQPLIFGITTAGYDRNSICYELYDYAKKVLNGVIEDPSFFAYVREAPENADWRDEKVWAMCNPALGEFRNIEEMREFAREAEQIPAKQNTFRRLYLNQWTAQSERWLDLAAWDASAGVQIDPLSLKGRRCYAGLDLASTTDVAALVLVFPPQEEDGAYIVLPYFWIPGDNVLDREKRDRVPYREWVRQGLIEATEGNVIDYVGIKRVLSELRTLYNIREIAFDRWGATQLAQELHDAGVTVVPFGQGFASMSPPTKELMALVMSKRLRHGGHPVLRWMADNMVVRQDPAGNLKPDKQKSTQKIDGMVALVMALDRATRHKTSIYESRGLSVL